MLLELILCLVIVIGFSYQLGWIGLGLGLLAALGVLLYLDARDQRVYDKRLKEFNERQRKRRQQYDQYD